MHFFRKLKYSLVLTTFLTHPSFSTEALTYDEKSPIAIGRKLTVQRTDYTKFNALHAGRYQNAEDVQLIPIDQIPSSYDLSQYFTIVDQGQYGSCTANAGTGAFYAKQVIEAINTQQNLTIEQAKAAIPYGSRFDIYNIERELNGTSLDDDSGSDLGTLGNVLKNYGVPPESLFPYTSDDFTVDPISVPGLQEVALKNVYKGNLIQDLLYNESDMVTKIKQAIASNIPVVIAIQVPPSLQSQAVAETGMLPMPVPGTPSVGGHAVVAGGFNNEKQLLTIINSWGPNWGVNGIFYIPYAFVNDPNWLMEAWMVSSVTPPEIVPVPTPPVPVDPEPVDPTPDPVPGIDPNDISAALGSLNSKIQDIEQRLNGFENTLFNIDKNVLSLTGVPSSFSSVDKEMLNKSLIEKHS